MILPVVLYGCGTWSLTLREECRLRVCENRVLRRYLGLRGTRYKESGKKVHNEELNDLHSSPIIVRMIKSRRMLWAGHVARMWVRRGDEYTGFWWGYLMDRDHLGDPGVNWRIILRWIFRKLGVGYGLDRGGSGYRQLAGTCECGNEPSGSIKCGEFLG
jgi:hypothetical protein